MRRLLIVVGVIAGSMLFAAPAEAGGGCHGGAPSGTAASVELERNCMNPRVLTATDGKVTFVNRDAVVHNLTGDGWFFDDLSQGESVTHTFPAGTHVYSCTLHPGMVGAVVVGDAPTAPALAAATTPAADDSNLWVLAGIIGLVLGSGVTVAIRRFRTE